MGEEHKATKRVLDILELVGDHNENGLKFSEIVSLLGESKGTLHPMVMTMANRDYLFYDQNEGKYHLGLQIANLGKLCSEKSDLLSEIDEVLERVVKIDYVTAFCGVLSTDKVLYLLRKEASGNVKVIAKKGSRIPASCTAIGKALLSKFSREKLEKLYPEGLPQLTENSITDLNVLYVQCKEVEKTGIATEVEESNKLIRCFATPIVVDQKVCAAISAAFPILIDKEETLEEIKSLLLSARKEIEELISRKKELWIYS